MLTSRLIKSIYNIFGNIRLVLAVLVGLIAFAAVEARELPLQPRKPLGVVGVVTDSLTGERLGFVNVWSKAYKRGVTTNDHGVFKLRVPVGAEIEVSSLGYAPKKLKVKSNTDTIRFMLAPSATELAEVVVKPKKKKYSKKNNPAVELMRRVRADFDKVRPDRAPLYSYNRYDKIILALNNYSGYLPDSLGNVKGRGKAIYELVDTAAWTGKRILTLSMKENSSTVITADGSTKEIVRGFRSNGFDKQWDNDIMSVFLTDALREVNVYDNDITLMRSHFVSPLSRISADYYMFHIEDTVQVGNQRCVELSFAPHNPESLGFNGKLYVPVDDSLKYVTRVVMRLPKAANVNYVNEMVLNQTFRLNSRGQLDKIMDDVALELSFVGTFGELYASRQSRYTDHSYEKRQDMANFYDRIGNHFEIDESRNQPYQFWDEQRLVPLSRAEQSLAHNRNPFMEVPLIKAATEIINLLMIGYIPTGKKSKFDIGTLDSFISYNATEGLRLGLGGMTTANLSDHLFARANVAYGMRDHRWKFGGELEYSFIKKKYHSREFPMNGIRLTYKYDIFPLGENDLVNEQANLLNSFRRKQSDLNVYQRLGKLEYNVEWHNNLSLNATLKYLRITESPTVKFINGLGKIDEHYMQNSVKVALRYAPGEKFAQSYNTRMTINMDAMELRLSHEFGPKGFLGSNFTTNITEFYFKKRQWFSMFGYADFTLMAAKLWSQVPFPALLWPNANTSYRAKKEAFNLMNPMELAMDEYVSWDLYYNFNGLLFNRIPLIKKLKLKETFSFRGVWGHLTSKNDPSRNPDLYRFPDPNTRAIGSQPYMEIGAGIDNILTLFQVEYIWRLTYRDAPGAPNHGVRFGIRFNF